MTNGLGSVSSDAGPAAAGLRISRDALGLADAPRAPASGTERQLAKIWADALLLDRVGAEDDFFEVGGDSLIAEAIALAASVAFHRNIRVEDLASHPTVAAMAQFFDQTREQPTWSPPAHISVHRAGGKGAPVFYVPGGLGQFFPRSAFTDALSPERPQFVVQTIGLRGEPLGPGTVPEIARANIRSIARTIGDQPFHLAGICAGADMALEMAHQTNSLLSLTLFDSRAPYRMRNHRSPIWFADGRRWVQTEVRKLRLLAIRALRGGESPIDLRLTQDEAVDRDNRDYDASAARIVDAARRRHMPRRWNGDATLIASEQYVGEGAAAWRTLVGALEVQTLTRTHAELFHSQAAATGATFERRLTAAERN